MHSFAPVDGVINSIEKVMGSDNKKWLKVLISKRLFDVSVVRSPFRDAVNGCKEKEGLSHNTTSPLSKIIKNKSCFYLKEVTNMRYVWYCMQECAQNRIEISSKRGRFKAGEKVSLFIAR